MIIAILSHKEETIVITKKHLKQKQITYLLKQSKDKNKKIKRKIKIKTKIKTKKLKQFTATEFFKQILEHDAKILIAIRDGTIVYDPSKLITCLRANIKQGTVIGTRETIIHKLLNIRKLLRDISTLKTQALDNTYMANVEAAQAALVMKGINVTVPNKLPSHMLRHKKLSNYSKTLNEIVKTYKSLEHGKLKYVKGKKLDDLIWNTRTFISAVKQVL